MARILVIGPGALGTIAACRLAVVGQDVTVAVRDRKRAKALDAIGLRAIGPDGHDLVASPPFLHSPRSAGPYDLIVHTTRLDAAPRVLRRWLPTLAEDGLVVPFQNGVEGGALQAIAGQRLLECSVFFPATLERDGVSRQSGPGSLVLGPWPHGDVGPGSPARLAAELLQAVAPCEVHPDMRSVKWTKLVVNAAMTGLGAVTDATMHDMLQDRQARTAILAIIREGAAVMDAQGIPSVRVGSARPRLLLRLPGPLAHGALRVLGRRYGDYRSSSAQSLRRGGKTEVAYLNGRIAEDGLRLGVPTPVNAAVAHHVAAIEDGLARQGMDAIPALLRSNAHA